MSEVVLYPPIAALRDAHSMMIKRSGSPEGERDPDLLEACLARPEQLRAYKEGNVTIFELAGALAYLIAKVHHPFIDGNKRVAFISIVMMLGLNGYFLDAGEHDAAQIILDISSNEKSEAEFCAWIKKNSYKS